ncbi:hypothetical protein KFK09_021833 [Dendrobium nobile]|uniref:Uncharacterized protein n=1 Tax=Dendrobium nobile TaxID=94219 RepID=A0A8T3AID6_DENNO|nr:hypothetical protein KFK09_021833 [Dendrobium nobile]
MEVVVPVPEFHFHTAMTTPYISAPSSPPNHFTDNSSFIEFHHSHHVSAPSSPTSSAAIYAAFRRTAAATRGSRHSSIPFDWEEKPGTPKSSSFDQKEDEFDQKEDEFDFDFSIGFSGQNMDKLSQRPPASHGKVASLATADELFEFGKIRPLKPPPRLYSPVMGEQGPKSPRSGGFLSPLRRGRNRRGKELDPFVLAMVEATKSRRESRSLSPFGGRGKVGSFLTPVSSPPRNSTPMAEKGGRGWMCRLKELLLFRSSSEGRDRGETKNKDFSKYGSSSSSSSASSTSSLGSAKGKTGFSAAGGGGCEESSCSSFRSEESGSTRRGPVVPQELEFTENRTVVVMDKKLVVPYKQSMFSVRGFTAGKFGASFIRRRT